MSYVQNPQPPARSILRWLLFPVLAVLFFGGILFLPRVLFALDVDMENVAPFMMMTQLALPIGVLVLGLWWFIFSGVRWAYRLALPVLLVGALGTAAYFSIRNLEFTTQAYGLIPVFHFTWEPSAEEKLAQHLQQSATNKDALPAIDATVGPEDFANYRGPKFDGVVTHLRLETDWTKSPPTEIWRQPCPGGYSGIAVAGNIAVTLQQRGEKEVVVCYDRATGVQRWEFTYDASWKDVMGNGPRSTPTIHDGRIYTLGATGELLCLDAKGDKQWATNVLKDSKAVNIKWGLTGSPLIVDDLVVANAGINPDNNAGMALVAYDQKTGTRKWALSHHRAGYSSPFLATLDGVRQIVMFHGDALVGHDPKTGVELWTIPWKTQFEMNSIQPVVVGSDRVFISSEKDNGCGLFRIRQGENKKWEFETVWKNTQVGARFANPVTDGTHLFCLHNIQGVITCLNVSDGTVKWRGPRLGPGQLLLVDDTLLVTNGDTGAVSLFTTDSAECTELSVHRTFDTKTWNTPALAGDQLFVRNQYEIVCLKLPRR
jgi:outer membrane protein assembly factor BamB